MRKLRPDAITKQDLSEYVATQDDFALELRTLAALKGNGYFADHGGTYTDPVTKQNRQYDIRASKTVGNCQIQLAVECKCLQPNYPLLVSCVRRTREEAYHELIMSRRDKASTIYFQSLIKIKGHGVLYSVDEYVGKSTAQVGKSPNADEFVSGDADIYEKWSQAIASSFDLVTAAASIHDGFRITVVLPVLVVPDGTIWQIRYNESGNQDGEPATASECSIYIGKKYRCEKFDFTLSHINVFGFTRFTQWVSHIGVSSPNAELIFPPDQINKALGTKLASPRDLQFGY